MYFCSFHACNSSAGAWSARAPEVQARRRIHTHAPATRAASKGVSDRMGFMSVRRVVPVAPHQLDQLAAAVHPAEAARSTGGGGAIHVASHSRRSGGE